VEETALTRAVAKKGSQGFDSGVRGNRILRGAYQRSARRVCDSKVTGKKIEWTFLGQAEITWFADGPRLSFGKSGKNSKGEVWGAPMVSPNYTKMLQRDCSRKLPRRSKNTAHRGPRGMGKLPTEVRSPWVQRGSCQILEIWKSLDRGHEEGGYTIDKDKVVNKRGKLRSDSKTTTLMGGER